MCTKYKEYVGQINLRPHHGMCLYFFEGKGYSDDFTKHMAQVKERLEGQKASHLITIIDKTDEICLACPHNIDGACETIEKVNRYDGGVLSYTGIKLGESMTFAEFSRAVQEKILEPGYGRMICGDCGWSDICHKG